MEVGETPQTNPFSGEVRFVEGQLLSLVLAVQGAPLYFRCRADGAILAVHSNGGFQAHQLHHDQPNHPELPVHLHTKKVRVEKKERKRCEWNPSR